MKGVLYFGRQGGGARFTLDLMSEVPFSENHILIINSKNELRSEYENLLKSNVHVINVHSKIFIILPFYRKYVIHKICRIFLLNGVDSILITMPSPFDVYQNKTLRKHFHVTRVIHDANRHPGDWWPTQRDINRIILDCDSRIVLSESVKNVILSRFGVEPFVLPLPAPKFKLEIVKNSTTKYFLFVGRIKKYKNLSMLIKAWNLAQIVDHRLIIAGRGYIPFFLKISIRRNKTIELQNRWLSEEEIADLTINAVATVFPYSEASQSGILAWCLEAKLPVVISNNLFLISQACASNSEVIYLSEGNSPVQFSQILRKASDNN
jgi:glycosyltransferase involved in cell wall biosynthesis